MKQQLLYRTQGAVGVWQRRASASNRRVKTRGRWA